MEIADLHTHTRLCRHAEGSPEEFLAAALARGERYYGIADHCPFPSGFEPDWRMAESEFPEYRRIVGEMKRKAAGSGLSVLYGIEMDYVPGRRAEIEAKLAPEKMDYVIGSIHCVDGFCFDDPASLPVWESPGMAERIWKGYLRDLKIFVSEWNFQILGHPDLPKKFGYCAERTEEFFSSYREIFGIMKERGIALEVNVAGLWNPVKEIYPSSDLMRLAREAGLSVTYGSDAHAPSMIGRNYAEALQWAKEAGFDGFSVFVAGEEKRLPSAGKNV